MDPVHLTREEIDAALHSTGFSGIEANIEPPDNVSLSILSSLNAEIPKKAIALLVKAAITYSEAWVELLKGTLEQQGYEVCICDLQAGLPAEGEYLTISLLDMDGPYLHDLSEAGFTALQGLLADIKQPILWVTGMSQFRCENPRYGLVFGFARTMRHEKDADFSIFETDTFDGESVKSLVSVVEKLLWSRANAEADPEYEFALYQGTIYVGRCHWVCLADHMGSNTSLNLPRRLDIESLGSIDTLRWTPFEDPPLEEGQVEIEMKYIGLNFRVRHLHFRVSTSLTDDMIGHPRIAWPLRRTQ